MKRKLVSIIATIALSSMVLSGCESEAERVSYNISKEADNFNTVRQITVINCLQGDVIFQMTGKMSIHADPADSQLEVTVEDENGKYKKHFIGLSDNVTYVVEDITDNDVSKYRYTLNFNPKMWLPGVPDVEYID
jgi:PBP1b-binding outer membrane lipoprotein LpoB